MAFLTMEVSGGTGNHRKSASRLVFLALRRFSGLSYPSLRRPRRPWELPYLSPEPVPNGDRRGPPCVCSSANEPDSPELFLRPGASPGTNSSVGPWVASATTRRDRLTGAEVTQEAMSRIATSGKPTLRPVATGEHERREHAIV
jgi:hypothetical protein